MNFDDKYTKESEEAFQKHLKEVRSIPPETYKIIEENLIIVVAQVEKLKSIPNKSPEDLLLLAKFETRVKDITQKLNDIKLILDVSIYRHSLAYFENVKKLAKEGDKEAEKIYNELKIYVEKFDPN